MPNGHPKAILVSNRERPRHVFNDAVIGDGRELDVQVRSDERVTIRVNIGIPSGQAPGPILLRQQAQIGCRVSTDSLISLFQGSIAYQLNLQPGLPILGGVSTCVGRIPGGYWSEHRILLGLYPGYISIRVWFPIEFGNNGWQWKFGFPIWNVLGMRGVLNKRMLSMNALECYSMEWQSP